VVLYDAAIEFQRDPILKSHMSGLDLGQSVDGIPDSTRHRLDLHLSMESRATAWKGRDVEDLSTASAELVVKNLHHAINPGICISGHKLTRPSIPEGVGHEKARFGCWCRHQSHRLEGGAWRICL